MPVRLALLAATLLLAAPAEAATEQRLGDIGWKQMFMLLFLMLGPVKVLAPYVKLCKGLEERERRRLATRAILFSAAALILAGGFGRGMMDNFKLSPDVLALTGGLVLFLVALKTVMEQFSASPQSAVPQPEADTGDARRLAMNPLAFPTIVTPYGIAATIVFVALADDATSKLMVG